MRNFIFVIILSLLSKYAISQQHTSEQLNLMPWPKSIITTTNKFVVTNNFKIQISNKDQGKVNYAATKFLRRLSNRTGIFLKEGFPFKKDNNSALKITFDTVAQPSLGVDESYTLEVNATNIQLNAKTDIGAIRGLETLLQLLKTTANESYFTGTKINDAPRFLWRGLLIDAARHFQPVAVIKRNLEAMAAVKMNVFHWHLTDDQGFRIESKVYPKLHKLASDGLYYTQHQIKNVVTYATRLGIRVIPEIDVPGHASAILTAYPELGSKDNYTYSLQRNAGVFDPTLNPTIDKTYKFLENLFTEVSSLFPDKYFHIGGDENEGKHWTENKKIAAFKKKHQLKTNHDLQTYFNIKLEKILSKLGKKLMGWDEIMTKNMPTTAVIHSWRGTNEGLKESTLIAAAKKGYPTVLSNGYYIDRMQSVVHHYKVDPIGNAKLTPAQRANILGGEATMWGELVTPLTIDSRIWPRTAAIAERFWSPKNVTDIDHMFKRLSVVSFQLEELGITHIRNKDVILRNLTQNQPTKSLEVLSAISEPLKIYTRNAGGTEYQTYSPFTLFADACTADAPDALQFNSYVNQYITQPTVKKKQQLTYFFKKWISGYKAFQELKNNTKLQKIAPLYKNLNQVSGLFLNALKSGKSNAELTSALKKLSRPVEDVEIVIVNALEKLNKSFQ